MGFDEGQTPKLYQTEPAGTYHEWKVSFIIIMMIFTQYTCTYFSLTVLECSSTTQFIPGPQFLHCILVIHIFNISSIILFLSLQKICRISDHYVLSVNITSGDQVNANRL